MSRPRNRKNKVLPRGLRERDGYYSYRSPIDGKEIGIGRSRREAVQYAMTNNMALDAVHRKYLGAARILSALDISQSAITIEALCGVYFLLSGQTVIYVGKSTNVHGRLADHYSKKLIPFDRFHIVPCDARDVDHLEALYIGALRPKYNVDYRKAETLNGILYMGETTE